MKKNFKRVLLFSLIVLTLVVLTVVGASAMTDAEAIEAGNTVRIGDEGGTYYTTLANAVSAAKAGDTITVIKAHSLSAPLTIDKSLTIEGQGLQITAAGKTEISNSAVVTLNNFNLSNTVADYGINVTGSSTLTIDGADTYIYATKNFALQCGAGTLQIKDGTFTTGSAGKRVLWANSASSVVVVDGGKFETTGGGDRLLGMSYAKSFTINGGTFIHGGSNNLFYVDGGPLITINGGDFSYSTTSNNNGIIWTSKATSAFVITGGTFTGNANVFASNGPITVTGGTFKGNVQLTRNDGGTLAISGGTFEGDITVSKKTSLSISGDAVVKGNITVSSAATITVEGGEIKGSIALNAASANLTVNGGEITSTGDAITTNAVTSIALNGGEIQGNIAISANATVNVSGSAKVVGNVTASAAADITVAGGEINGSIALNAASAKLAVTGGSITSTGDAITATAAASIVLNGGTITAGGSALNLSGGAVATVDGTEINAVSDNVVDADSSIIVAGQNPYADDDAAIADGMTVRIGKESAPNTLYFKSLDVAVAAAEAGDTITIIKEHALSIALTISTSVTIEGQGLQITAADVTTIGGAAVVTLNNFNLSNTTKGIGINVTGDSTLTIGGADTTIYATTGFAVQCGAGTLSINDGTFTTADSGKRVLWANSSNSVLIVNGGTFVTTGGKERLLGMSYAKVFTINGGTFTHGGSNNLFYVEGGPLITINGGEFSYSTDTNNNGIIWTSTAASKFVINGGTFRGNANVLASNGPIEITGGTFYGVAQLTRNDGGSLTMTGGTLNGDITVSKKTTLSISGEAVINGSITVSADASITIDGGSIVSTANAITATAGKIAVSAGTITSDASIFSLSGAELVVTGGTQTAGESIVVATNSSSITVIGGAQTASGTPFVYDDTCTFANEKNDAVYAADGYVARVGEEGVDSSYYKSLAEAIAAAADGDTVVIITAFTLDQITIDKTITIDAQGKTLTLTGQPAIKVTDGTLTLDNIYLAYTGAETLMQLEGAAYVIFNDGVTIDYRSFTKTSGERGIVLENGTPTLEINGGTYLLAYGSSDGRFIWAKSSADATIIIAGGKFYCAINPDTKAITTSVDTSSTAGMRAIFGGQKGTITLTGGEFHTAGQNVLFAEGSAVVVISPENDSDLIMVKYGKNGSAMIDLKSTEPAEITGGTFTSSTKLLNTRANNQIVTITGGTFTAGTMMIQIEGVDSTIEIFDGSFTMNGAAGAKMFTAKVTCSLSIYGGSYLVENGYIIFFENKENAETGEVTTLNQSFITIDATLGEDGELKVPTFTQKAAATGEAMIAISAAADIYIGNGVFTSSGAHGHLIHIYKTSADFTGAVLTITGGTFVTENKTTGSLLKIEGGVCDEIYIESSVDELDNVTVPTFTQTAAPADGKECRMFVYEGTGYIRIAAGIFTNNAKTLLFNVDGGEVEILGGSFISTAAGEMVLRFKSAVATIYGGYFESNGDYVVRPDGADAELSIYGGYFTHLASKGGAPVRVGTGSDASVVLNVYGGTFKTNGSAAVIFSIANDNEGNMINLVSYNCAGGTKILQYGSNADHEKNINYGTIAKASYAALSLYNGASIRLVDGDVGIRFMSNVSADLIAALEEMGATDVTYGTIILPTDYLDGLATLSIDLLDQKGIQYMDIPAVDGIVENADGSLTIRAAIVGIKEWNIDREFSALVYAKYNFADMEITYVSSYCKDDNSRSLSGLAYTALYEDLSDVQEGYYLYEVEGSDKYSRYTSDQQKLLKDILGE